MIKKEEKLCLIINRKRKREINERLYNYNWRGISWM